MGIFGNFNQTAPLLNPYSAAPLSLGVSALDPNPALTAALHAHAFALNANTAIVTRQVIALEKANELQAVGSRKKSPIFR